MGYDGDELNISYACPCWAPALGFGGCFAAVVFASELPFEEKLPSVHDAHVNCDFTKEKLGKVFTAFE